MQIISFRDLNKHAQIRLNSDESYLLYYTFSKRFDIDTWNCYMNILPQFLRKEVEKYRKWQDRHNCLLGKLLVYFGYHIFCGKVLDFSNFLRDVYGKPYLSGNEINFNISHSGNTVVSIFSKNVTGIDIEKIEEVDYKTFNHVFSYSEMEIIKIGGYSKFYKFWTIKEAVCKAIGKGMGIPLLDIKINNNNNVVHNDVIWSTRSFLLDENICSIASKKPNINITLIEVKF